MSSLFFFQHPTTILISGPTHSGKTLFVLRVLKNSLLQPFPSRILWFFKEWQPAYDELKEILPSTEFSHGIDSRVLDSINVADKNLVVLDDLMSSAGESKIITELFTQASHHKNLTVIFIVQNLFYQGKAMRTISLNAHYFVLYKNPRDRSQIRSLAQQIFPENYNFLVNVFKHATEQSYSYLVIDLHPETKEDFRILANIFPGESIRFYMPTTL